MGMSLEEFAAQHPTEEPEEGQREREALKRTIKERREIEETTQRYKDSIENQLQQGNAPQYILYTAIKCIGLLTDDDEWAEDQLSILDLIYDDLAQQCIDIDVAAVEAFRLKERQQKYLETVFNHATRDIALFKKINQSLEDVLNAVQSVYDDDFWKERGQMIVLSNKLKERNKK